MDGFELGCGECEPLLVLGLPFGPLTINEPTDDGVDYAGVLGVGDPRDRDAFGGDIGPVLGRGIEAIDGGENSPDGEVFTLISALSPLRFIEREK